MTSTQTVDAATRLRRQLAERQPTVRLQAALAAGTRPDPQYVDALVERCAVEPDFFVRDMLTWALTRHPATSTVPRLLQELGHGVAQARSQALHTLSKIGEPVVWPAITDELLRDADDDVARSAWRAAVVLVPRGSELELARELVSQLGRGGRDLQLSLSRALAALGEVARPLVAAAATRGNEAVQAHALATERLIDDPDASFDAAVHEAQRVAALTGAPLGGGEADADR
jgi:HEAT repeat protein